MQACIWILVAFLLWEIFASRSFLFREKYSLESFSYLLIYIGEMMHVRPFPFSFQWSSLRIFSPLLRPRAVLFLQGFRHSVLKTPPVLISTMCWKNSGRKFKVRYLDVKTEFLVNRTRSNICTSVGISTLFLLLKLFLWLSRNVVAARRSQKSEILFSGERCV